MASVLSLLPTTFPPPRFCIFVNACDLLLTQDERLNDSIECLHIHDDYNTGYAKILAKQFGGEVYKSQHNCNSFSPMDMNIMGRFLIQQKRKLTACCSNILTLQNNLHLAELQAADLIAERIALNPPAALMAVIRPGHVSGWTGSKRRDPSAEGGGAPCPTDFLLHPEDRERRRDDPLEHSSTL